jgi:hypothetical protein
MTLWEWMADYEKHAQAAGDKRRLRLTEIHQEAWPHRETDPDHMLRLIEEGRCLADRLKEPWWVLFFYCWRVDVFIYWKKDYSNLQDLAIGNMLQARRAIYTGFPLNFAIHRQLASVYLGIDPLGYEEQIEELHEFIASEFGLDGEQRFALLNDKVLLVWARGRLDEVEEFALRQLALLDSDDSLAQYSPSVYMTLCCIAYRRKAWEELGEWARVGEEQSRKAGRQLGVAEFQMCQALLARRRRDEHAARRLHRCAIARIRRLRIASDGAYWDTLRLFHEAGGELERALQVCEQEIASLIGRGRLAMECDGLLQRLRLLAKLGRLSDTDVVATRTTIGRVRKPASYLAKLERYLRGDVEEE